MSGRSMLRYAEVGLGIVATVMLPATAWSATVYACCALIFLVLALILGTAELWLRRRGHH